MAGNKFDAKSFNPEAFGKYTESIPQLKTNELLKSRAIVGNPLIASVFNAQTGTEYQTIPLYGLLDGDPLNYDGQTDITATSTKTYEQSIIVTGRAKAWTEKDFSSDITSGVDFMGNISRQVSFYWDTVNQDTLLSVLEGIYAVPATGNNGLEDFRKTHTYDITGETDPIKQVVNAVTLNNAIQKASGANKRKFSLVIMHSAVATNLENMRLLDYMKYTDNQNVTRDLSLGTWNGKTVIIDDSMPTVEVPEIPNESEAYTAYTSYVLGEGAVWYENIGAKVPYEMERDPYTDGGIDTLITRQRKVFAPKGISYTKSVQKSLSPTEAELKNPKNWELVNDGASSNKSYYNHKAILISRIISRG